MPSANPIRQDWPAHTVETWPIEDLIPYARNAKQHPEEQVRQIAGSIEEFGFTIPILCAENGTIIAGHGRVLAAKSLGIAEVPVIVARGWSDERRRAYTIADNRLAENAKWDDDLLRLELGELREEGFDLDILGFDDAALAKILAEPEEEADPAPKLADRFGLPPFTVLSAREGWWQERKRAWLALGIKSELGRGENLASIEGAIDRREAIKKKGNAAPGGSARPAADYGKTRARGNGAGKAIENTAIVAGNGWGNGGPARRDPAFYAKKRAWEKANGRKISTTEFREQHWNGAVRDEGAADV